MSVLTVSANLLINNGSVLSKIDERSTSFKLKKKS